ncbi:GNAT family N-acetyltransferase [Maridesulfovibrio sp.]|uniref:GNAT family N-acetyltransferase n=1 Tax=Maridesulfovibrio sp. TaxID=2795000 RepID=UPI0029F5A65A|nr:GNAT family N-acetyltransferase [Maridesulfovibrio sp.]
MTSQEDPSVKTQEVEISSWITPDDVEKILNMIAASGLFSASEIDSAESLAWDCAYGNGSGPDIFLKATVNEAGNETVIGFLCFGPIPYWPGNYELYALAVEPEYQRMGIGSALLAEMNKVIAGKDGNSILLETKTDRAYETARLFCEANNFSPEHRFIKQFIPENGGIVYRCDLSSDVDNLL